MLWRYLIALVVLAAIAVAAVVFWPEPAREQNPEPAPVPTAAPPVLPSPAAPPGIDPSARVVVNLPPLALSDDFVRDQLDDLPVPGTWLAQEQLVQFYIMLVEGAADGDYPRRYLDFLAPMEPIRVRESDGRIWLDPESYSRYDPLVDELVQIPPERFAALVRLCEPLIAQGYLRGFGEAGVDVIERTNKAIEMVLAVPVIEAEIELTRPRVMYEFADPDLETQPALVKQLIRMGPDNVRRIQAYAAAVSARL